MDRRSRRTEDLIYPSLKGRMHDGHPRASGYETEVTLVQNVGIQTLDSSEAVVPGFKIDINLLPHQILGRSWLRHREDISNNNFGGILADEMGLGKTVQILSRVVENPRADDIDCKLWSGATLVVCPLALMFQWTNEIQKLTNLKVLKYQGTNRTKDPTVIQEYDVVVTTYDTVKAEFVLYPPTGVEPVIEEKDDSNLLKIADETRGSTKNKVTRKRLGLYQLNWWRIILDEGHIIRNVKTKGALACFELQARFRWCMTGTPIQNNAADIFPLLKFLRIEPLADWDTFREQIMLPLKVDQNSLQATTRLQVVLKHIMLRRHKDQIWDGKPLVDLPKRTMTIVSCFFTPGEREIYDLLESVVQSVVQNMLPVPNKQGNSACMLLLLLRLRQACDHPILILRDKRQDLRQKKASNYSDRGIVGGFWQMTLSRKCHLCSSQLTSADQVDENQGHFCFRCSPVAIKARSVLQEHASSAKIKGVLQLLQNIDERSNQKDKTVIFSQFAHMLQVLESFLTKEGIECVQYDGSLSVTKREAALQTIKTSLTTRVILVSLESGCTGLNLTSCNNVILVDTWWNPALEDQAFDRVHRLGQKHDVNLYKLKVEDTVEDKILALQGKKRSLAAAIMKGNTLERIRLGVDELVALL